MSFSSVGHGSALYFYEIGTEDTALAGAGQAARAQDASIGNWAGDRLIKQSAIYQSVELNETV